jgi:glutathione synthase/RimK-type ligase-like ATP-grasp enzyme
MKENTPDNGPVCVFMLGVNDTRTAAIKGFNSNGKMDYDWYGNTEFSIHTHTPFRNRMIMPILWFQNETIKISQPDIFVNCISDADGQTKSLAKAAHYLGMVSKQWPGIPVFNDPRKIAGTRRDMIYQRFHHLPGIDIPRIIRFQPKNRNDVLTTAAKEGFTYPFIVRSCGSHNGRDMVLLEAPDRADDLDCLAFDGSSFYLTQFRDYKNAAGLYSKARFVVMDGKIYPRHFITARHWKVSGGSRNDLMKSSADMRDSERQMLSALEQKIAPEALDSVQKIYQEVGLDYLGFDCHLLPNGNLLFFEVNASMNAMARSDYETYPHLKTFGEKLINGYNALLAGKIGARESRRHA